MANIRLSPSQAILLSYAVLISVGTALFLLLPTTIRSVSPVDALFTVTSAVTVTGLIVLDTQRDLTFLGQCLLLLLIQIGGLGYMTLTTFLLITLGKRIGLRERLVLAEALNYPGVYGLVRFLKRVVVFVLLSEGVGFLLLYLLWIDRFGPEGALFPALFHSVSAFNNAGFSLFSDNLIPFRGDVATNLIVSALIIVGGIGFFVINDLYLFLKGKVPRLSTHTKLVLTVSSGLIVLGWVGLLMTEAFHRDGLWSLGWKERILSTLFFSISSRTAGFNTFDTSLLSESSVFLIMLLMFIGASPGSTGGGVKTTNFAVLVLAVLSYIRGRAEAVVFSRSLTQEHVRRAMVVTSLGFMYIALVNLIIDRVEERDFLSTLFEVVSAFSTVGLSVGNGNGLSFSAELSPISKVLIVITMLVGRVGVLSFAIALIGRETESRVRHPEARLLL